MIDSIDWWMVGYAAGLGALIMVLNALEEYLHRRSQRPTWRSRPWQ